MHVEEAVLLSEAATSAKIAADFVEVGLFITIIFI